MTATPTPGTGEDQASMAGWARTLPKYPPVIKALGDQYQAMAKDAQENLPASKALVESLNRATALLRAAEEAAKGWYPGYQRANEADEARLQQPRGGSHAREARADYRSAEQDLG